MNKFVSLVFLLLTGTVVRSQNPSHVLLTKDAELEYRTYSSRPISYTKFELYEVTRVTLKVTDVKDSNGIRYGYITKTGKAIQRPEENWYEKKYMVMLEGNKLKIPKDLYSADTIYLSDRYPELRKGKGYHAVMQIKDPGYIIFDLDSASKGVFRFSAESEEIYVKSREFIVEGAGSKRQAGDQIYFGGTLRSNDYTIHVSNIEVKNEGNTTFRVRAGNFKCYKLSSSSKIKIKGAGLLASLMKPEVNSVLYYSPEIGLLKTEDNSGKNQTGYIELFRVKR